MGILDDTLADAARPLPTAVLRRAPIDGAPEFDPEPVAEPSDDLTVYRLQKDGGNIPPPAPPVPRAVDAGAPEARPLHAPVGIVNDASLQFVISNEGLETGKEPVSTRNLDATDKQQRLVSTDPIHRWYYADSTVSLAFSRRVPFTFDARSKSVSRIESSDGMRRATGRGAPSGDPDPSPAVKAPAAPADSPADTLATAGPAPAAMTAPEVPGTATPTVANGIPATTAAAITARPTAPLLPNRAASVMAAPRAAPPAPTM